MKRLMYVLTGLSLLTFVACSTNSVNDDELSAWEEENTQQVQDVLNADEDLNFTVVDDGDENNIDNDDPNWVGSASLGKTAAMRTHYGRIRKHPVERNIQIIFDTDTTATAYIYTKLKGIFVVHKAELVGDTVSVSRYEKPMTHEVERVVHLKKVRDTEQARLNWKITDISMRSGASPNATVEIVEVDVMPSEQDSVVITDPLSYFMNGNNMFLFPRFTDVSVRVIVKNTSATPMIYPDGTEATEMVRLYYGRNRLGNFARKAFTWVGKDDLGNNVYEGSWTIQQIPGMRHHALIDVVDNGTVLSSDNDAYPYNSNTWSTPYMVTVF